MKAHPAWSQLGEGRFDGKLEPSTYMWTDFTSHPVHKGVDRIHELETVGMSGKKSTKFKVQKQEVLGHGSHKVAKRYCDSCNRISSQVQWRSWSRQSTLRWTQLCEQCPVLWATSCSGGVRGGSESKSKSKNGLDAWLDSKLSPASWNPSLTWPRPPWLFFIPSVGAIDFDLKKDLRRSRQSLWALV